MRFVDNGDGTITDNNTGLMWEQGPGGEVCDWGSAFQRCESLDLAGHQDWRLPTIEELSSIVDYQRFDPACDPLLGTRSNLYWSSSTYVFNPRFAWLVYFFGGDVYADSKTNIFSVRPVRGGQP